MNRSHFNDKINYNYIFFRQTEVSRFVTKIVKFLKPYMGATVAALFFSLFNNLMQLILPAMMALMINTGIGDGRMGTVQLIGGVMAVLSAIAIGAAVAGSYYSSKVSACFGLSLRRALFVKVESLSQCDIDKIGTPSLITRTTNDIRQIQDMILMMIRIIISAPIVMVGGAFMAFTLNKRLSTVMFIAIPIILVIALVVAKQVLPMFDKAQKKTDRLNLILREKLSGIRVIRAFNRSEYEDEKFRKANYDLTGLMLKINRIFAFLIPLATLLCYVIVAILLKMAADQIDALDAVADSVQIANTVGDLQAFMVYMIMIIYAVSMAASLFVMLPKAEISAKRINEVLDLVPMIKETEHPITPDADRRSELEFDCVSFSYPGADSPILSRISFKTMPGETTAVIGSTGSGKSTLVNLIPRFYDVSGGRILIDGVDIKKYVYAYPPRENRLHPAERIFVQRHRRRQPAHGQARRDRRRDVGGARNRAGGRLCQSYAGRTRQRALAKRQEPFRRSAPAPRDSARADKKG